MKRLPPRAMAAALRSATSQLARSSPSRGGSLEKTVTDSAEAVNGADTVLLG
jgi:hypothetical protein